MVEGASFRDLRDGKPLRVVVALNIADAAESLFHHGLLALLRLLGFRLGWAMVGASLWLSQPAILGAWVRPTGTRDDPLAYFLLHVGLICVIRRNTVGILVCTVLGVLTRETLLILPIVHLLFAAQSVQSRLSSVTAGLLTYGGIRVLMGWERYAPIHTGLMVSLGKPVESLVAVALLLGVLWPFPLIYCASRWRRLTKLAWSQLTHALDAKLQPAAPCRAVLRRRFLGCLLPVGCLIIGTHVVLAQIRELRVSTLFGPWAVCIAVQMLCAIQRRLGPRRMLVVAGAILLSMIAGVSLLRVAGILTAILQMAGPHMYFFAHQYWLGIIAMHSVFSLCAIAVLSARPQRRFLSQRERLHDEGVARSATARVDTI